MNPLANEWAIKHRADACALTNRPYEPAPPTPADPLGKESAEQLFRRLLSSENAPRNACYVLAAMLERKKILKQVKSEQSKNGLVLIYEHAATGDVFIVQDPQLRLDELEAVQDEVAQLLRSAAAAP